MLTKIADAKDVAETLDEFSPPHAQYRALKAKLAEAARQDRRKSKSRRGFRTGRRCEPGMEDARVPLLRKRLKLAGDDDRPALRRRRSSKR